MAVALRLADTPDWPGAVEALGGALARSDAAGRVDVLDAIASNLGDALYPGFVQLLCAVRHFGDGALQELVADTLAEAVATAKLPACSLPAWGGHFTARATDALAFNRRSFGPLEFLCAAQWQGFAGGPLPRESFEAAVFGLLGLMAASPRAVSLYAAKLEADLADPLEGGFTQVNRAQIARFIETWRADAPIERVAQPLLD